MIKNNLWSTNPEIASMLLDRDDGYRYSKKNRQKVDWVCRECENIVEGKTIDSVVKSRLICKICSDGMSYGEKVLYHILKEANIKFDYDSQQSWSGVKRYDFYLPKYKTIIEVHGNHHYRKYNRLSSRSLDEEQKNDEIKRDLAQLNGIQDYIVIDSRKSELKWIKTSVLNSSLIKIIPNINFERIQYLAGMSFVKTVSSLWEKESKNTIEIINETRLSRGAVIKYLKLGHKLGWCNYDAKKEMIKASYNQGLQNNKPVLQFTLEGTFIKEWHSSLEAAETLQISKGNISSVCTGKRHHAGGFKWMHKDKYNKQLDAQG